MYFIRENSSPTDRLTNDQEEKVQKSITKFEVESVQDLHSQRSEVPEEVISWEKEHIGHGVDLLQDSVTSCIDLDPQLKRFK